MISNNWLYLEPFVHISLIRNKVLLYNTLNGKALEYDNNIKIYNLVKRLDYNKNLLVVKLTKSDLANTDIKSLLYKIRVNYMGDIINSPAIKFKPVQIKPIFNIQRSIQILKESGEASVGTNVMQNLTEVSININSECNLNCKNCKYTFKQFHFCTKYDRLKTELDIIYIKKIITALAGSSLKKLNITGGNILMYSKIEELTNLLLNYTSITEFYIHYKNILEYSDAFCLLNNKFMLNVLIDFPINLNGLESIKILINKKNIKTSFTFIINKIENLIEAEEHIVKLNIENYTILPYFDRSNLSFFKNNIFISKKDIYESKPTITDIYARQVINPNYFGKLGIMCNGSIYANLNGRVIGNIKNLDLNEAATKEMKEGTNWRKTRANITPCKDCLYKFICPPISDYEYGVGSYNLCKIN
jgi:pseudo-rSAM protein